MEAWKASQGGLGVDESGDAIIIDADNAPGNADSDGSEPGWECAARMYDAWERIWGARNLRGESRCLRGRRALIFAARLVARSLSSIGQSAALSRQRLRVRAP